MAGLAAGLAAWLPARLRVVFGTGGCPGGSWTCSRPGAFGFAAVLAFALASPASTAAYPLSAADAPVGWSMVAAYEARTFRASSEGVPGSAV